MQKGFFAAHIAGNTIKKIKAAFARPGVLVRENC